MTKPYYAEWYSCDGLSEGEIASVPVDAPYPAMVRLELSIGSSLTAEDAQELASHIAVAAEWAQHEHRIAFKAAPVQDASSTTRRSA